MGLKKPLPWLIAAAAISVTVVVMVLVGVSRRQADTSRDELQTLLRVSSQINLLNALEWQAIGQQEVTPEVLDTVEQTRISADARLLAMAGGDQPLSSESVLLLTYRNYTTAISQELALVGQGRIDAAQRLDAESVDPLHAELRSRVDDEVSAHEDQVRAAALRSDVGGLVIIATGTAVVGGLLWSQEAIRRRAQLAIAARQKAEALQVSEQNFRAMVENLSEIIYVLDTDGRISYVSPAIHAIAGYDPEEVLGRTFTNLIHDEDMPRVTDAFAQTLSGGSEQLEFRALTAGGGIIWVRSSNSPVFENGQPAGVRGVLMDITDLKSAEEDLQRTTSSLEAIVEASPLSIIAIDPENLVTMWNPAAEHLFGWAAEEVLGRPYPLVPVGNEREYNTLIEKILAGGEFTDVETQRLRKDGSSVDVAISAAPLHDAAGEVIGALGVIADITTKRQAEETIRHLAYHDPLTGLPNRALLMDRLDIALAQARRSRTQLAVLYLDLDNFKVVNDSVGHGAGDVLLRDVAARLARLVRETDTVARVGGDEFTILLAPPVGDKEASEVARRIVSELRGPWQYENTEFNVSGSVGVAVHPADGADAVTLLKNADHAMYAAKSEGRDTFRVYRESMHESSEYRLALERGLRHALQENQFIVHYQPQINLTTGRMAGVEALVRWNHPERGLLLPAEFLPLAEETGAVVEIDERVLETAARQLVAWHAAGHTRMTMAVNLSALHFHSRGFLRKMRRLLSDTGVDPSCLFVEITETIAMHQSSRTLRVLSALKRMGFGVVVDDFGTGHSSLTYLRRFPVDAIKIDRSFVSGIGRNTADEMLVTAVVALAHSLDLDVIAEGVETSEQLEFLQNLRMGQKPERPRGCDYFQGFLSSRPVPPEAIEVLLDAESAFIAAV